MIWTEGNATTTIMIRTITIVYQLLFRLHNLEHLLT